MTVARSNSMFGINGPFRVLVSLVIIWSFLFSAIAPDLLLFRSISSVGRVWADNASSELSDDGSDRPVGPGEIKELNVANFRLPAYLGRVKDSYAAPNPGKVVVHIQDAHCNYACQQQIARIVEYFNREYGADNINLEGGSGGYDLSVFTEIADKSIRGKAADHFVKEGLVNGAEYFAINNPGKVDLWGIEDTELYIENLRVYRDSLAHKDEVDKHLKALTRILNSLKIKIYPRELLELDTKYSQYEAGRLEFKDYIGYLIKAAERKRLDIKPFADVYLLSRTLSQESDIDFTKANNQRDELIDRLQKDVSKKSLEELVMKTVEFKSERISQNIFYRYLTEKAALAGIALKDFPEFNKYIAYASMYDRIDKTKVMEEARNLEKELKGSLYQNDRQRELDKLSKNLTILKNIFNVSLTKEDYEYYLSNERSFYAANYVSFINREAPLCEINIRPDKDIAVLDNYRESIAGFYGYSLKRDDVFINNIRFDNGQKIAVMITGGFHTENLSGMFKKRGVSYISIMPNFKNREGYESPYFKILSSEKYPDIRELLPNFLNKALAIPDLLSPEMMKAVTRAGMGGIGVGAQDGEAAPKPAAEAGAGQAPERIPGIKNKVKLYLSALFNIDELKHRRALKRLGITEAEYQTELRREEQVIGQGYGVIGGVKYPSLYARLRDMTGNGFLAYMSDHDVYNPVVENDFLLSLIFGEYIKRTIASDFSGRQAVRILVVGCGTGIDAMSAYSQAKSMGQDVILDAVDINPYAVENTEFNFNALYGKLPQGVRVRRVELGSKENPGREFLGLRDDYDVIIFNAPTITDGEAESLTVDINKDEFVRLLDQISRHLSASGEVMLCSQEKLLMKENNLIPEQLHFKDYLEIDNRLIVEDDTDIRGERRKIILLENTADSLRRPDGEYAMDNMAFGSTGGEHEPILRALQSANITFMFARSQGKSKEEARRLFAEEFISKLCEIPTEQADPEYAEYIPHLSEAALLLEQADSVKYANLIKLLRKAGKEVDRDLATQLLREAEILNTPAPEPKSAAPVDIKQGPARAFSLQKWDRYEKFLECVDEAQMRALADIPSYVGQRHANAVMLRYFNIHLMRLLLMEGIDPGEFGISEADIPALMVMDTGTHSILDPETIFRSMKAANDKYERWSDIVGAVLRENRRELSGSENIKLRQLLEEIRDSKIIVQGWTVEAVEALAEKLRAERELSSAQYQILRYVLGLDWPQGGGLADSSDKDVEREQVKGGAEDQIASTRKKLAEIDASLIGSERTKAHLALRGSLCAEALSEIEHGHMNVIVQIVPFDLLSKATGETNEACRVFRERNYNINAKSIEIGCQGPQDLQTQLEGIESRILEAIKGDAEAMALIYVPKYLLDPDGKIGARLRAFMDSNSNIKVQLIDSEDRSEYPDVMTFFELGVKLLDYIRDYNRAIADNKRIDPRDYTSLLNVLAAIAEDSQDPIDFLNNLFKFDYALRIRKIDLSTLPQAAEAMRMVRTSL